MPAGFARQLAAVIRLLAGRASTVPTSLGMTHIALFSIPVFERISLPP
jgi:hypothetical protein